MCFVFFYDFSLFSPEFFHHKDIEQEEAKAILSRFNLLALTKLNATYVNKIRAVIKIKFNRIAISNIKMKKNHQ